jgi:hypothetical protein
VGSTIIERLNHLTALVMWTCGCGLPIVLLTYPPKTGVTYFQELPKQTAVEPGELAEIGGDAQVEWRDRSPIRSPFGHCGAITKERAAAG